MAASARDMRTGAYLCANTRRMRYFMNLSYKGTNYHGWQIQRNAPSVQAELERALSTVLRLPTPVTGAGRTDTGVHARDYTAHFDAAPVAEAEALRYQLNAMLPDDIAVHRIRRVRDDAHARFDAAEREYTYYMRSEKDPFSRETSWQYRGALDTAAMNEAAAHLLAFDDFTTFAKLNSANKTNICKVTYARWRQEGTELIFTIRANRFLRNMVRAITGTLVGVGRGKMTPDEFRSIIAARDLSRAGSSAPAQGLFLTAVRYPEEIFLDSDTPSHLP